MKRSLYTCGLGIEAIKVIPESPRYFILEKPSKFLRIAKGIFLAYALIVGGWFLGEALVMVLNLIAQSWIR
jgi:hypothetical protein